MKLLTLLLSFATILSVSAQTPDVKDFVASATQRGTEPVDYIFYTDELGRAYTKLLDQAPAIKDAFDEGGYEARSSSYKAGTAELIIEEGRKVLKEML